MDVVFQSGKGNSSASFQETGLVGGHHVLDVDKGIFTTMLLKCLKCLLDEVSNVLSLLLAVVYPISNVHYKMRK